MKIQKVFKPVTSFDEIDITKALTTSGRVFYPKIGRKTRIDDFLARRTHLKLLEERRLSQSEKLKEIANKTNIKKSESEADVDVEGTEESTTAGIGDAATQNVSTTKQVNKSMTPNTKEVLAAIWKRIQHVRTQYASLTKLGGKNISCYSRNCNLATQNLTSKTVITTQSLANHCYSPMCMKKIQLKRDLVILLRKANALNNNQSATLAITTAAGQSTTTKTEPIEDSKSNIKNEPEEKVESGDVKPDVEIKNELPQDDGSGDAPAAKKPKIEPVGQLMTNKTNGI